MTLEQLDAELKAARERFRRLRDEAIAEFTAEAAAERNPHMRQAWLEAAEKVSRMGRESSA